jgi:hypothetical protein
LVSHMGFSAALCVISAPSAVKFTLTQRTAEGRRGRRERFQIEILKHEV